MPTNEERILELVKEADPENPIEYVRSIVRPMARKKLDEIILDCHDCPACATNCVKSLTFGHDQASILIVNEGIAKEQIGSGQKIVYPLQGTPEMEYMDKIIDAYHINRNQLFWMNAINCWPTVRAGRKNIDRPPGTYEVEHCRGFVERAIEILDPVIIILVGNIPLNLFTKGKTVMQIHGEWIDVHGIKAMPVYSPRFLKKMRDDKEAMQDLVEEYELEFCEDLRKAFVYVQDNFEGNVLLEKLEK